MVPALNPRLTSTVWGIMLQQRLHACPVPVHRCPVQWRLPLRIVCVEVFWVAAKQKQQLQHSGMASEACPVRRRRRVTLVARTECERVLPVELPQT
jgi:hypothetical protein